MRKIALCAAALAVALMQGFPTLGSELNVSYGPHPAQVLDICTPSDSGGPAPGLLVIHGGGWRGGSRAALARRCAMFADAGIVAIAVDYRLTTGAPGTTWPAQFNDVQLAMRWVRSHAEQYGIDPTNICAEGDSAGGQLALLLGVVPAVDPGDMSDLLPDVSPRANCVVSVSGPSDLGAFARVQVEMVWRLVGQGDSARVAALLADASPAQRARTGAPPALLVHGTEDPVVPFAQAESMRAALAGVGAPCWLVSHDGGHGGNGLTLQQSRGVWALVGSFVKSHHLAGPPRQLPVEEAISQTP